VECFMVLPAITAVLVWDVPVVPEIVFDAASIFVGESVDRIKDDNLVEMTNVINDKMIVINDVMMEIKDDEVMMEILDDMILTKEVFDDIGMVEMFDGFYFYLAVGGFLWSSFLLPPETFRDVWPYSYFALVGVG